jgi:hypothetical protein
MGWDFFFLDIINIYELSILILLFSNDPKKNVGLQLLKLYKTSKMHILEAT